jgi:hypothetical protein
MTAALTDEPKIPFTQPSGIEMRNSGGVTEAFKTGVPTGGSVDQPSASAGGAAPGGATGGDGNASNPAPSSAGGSGSGTGIDNSVGGLY